MKRGNKKGFKHSEETKEKMRLSKLGNKHWNFGGKNFNSGKTLFKKGVIPWNKGINTSDKKSDHLIRTSPETIFWRKSCFERDKFICQKTGQLGGTLEVHHILTFKEYPELRFTTDNGITLSKEAHGKFHKIYGRKNNTREQLLEFLLKD